MQEFTETQSAIIMGMVAIYVVFTSWLTVKLRSRTAAQFMTAARSMPAAIVGVLLMSEFIGAKSTVVLAAVTCPTFVLWGQKSHPAVRRANELLGRCISRASTMTVPGAAHFMISTHAKEVADAIAQHLDEVQRERTTITAAG